MRVRSSARNVEIVHRDVPRASHWPRKNEKLRSGGEFLVLEPAIPAREPIAPNRPKLHGVDDLRGFSKLPVLVTIPAITTHADRTRRRLRMPLAACASVVGLVLIVGAAYVGAHHNAVISLLTRTGP